MSFNWNRINQQHDKVVVLASGPSLRGVPLRRLQYKAMVICVNDMALHEPWCDMAFTLDSNVLLYRMRLYSALQKVAAVPENYLAADARKRGWRELPLDRPKVAFLKRLRSEQILDDKAVIGHANHSGSGAVNLAYHMQPKKLLLLGLDHRNLHQYAYGEGRECRRPWVDDLQWYRRSASLFERAGCQVVNGSPHSRIEAWQRVDPETGINWILGDGCRIPTTQN
jgi:hypothetical protein